MRGRAPEFFSPAGQTAARWFMATGVAVYMLGAVLQAKDCLINGCVAKTLAGCSSAAAMWSARSAWSRSTRHFMSAGGVKSFTMNLAADALFPVARASLCVPGFPNKGITSISLI